MFDKNKSDYRLSIMEWQEKKRKEALADYERKKKFKERKEQEDVSRDK